MDSRGLLLILLTCCGAQAAADSDNAPLVHTASGDVRGAVQHTNDRPDKPVYTFLGIPYAAPPVGDLRFRTPQPAAPWEGVRDATRTGPFCPQGLDMLKILPFQLEHHDFDEDCLTLNIETPTVANDTGLPVLLWIHGGSFTIGTGRFRPFAALAAHQDVVVVTINYRLGALGFLSTGDENAPGNFGLLDQIQAMEWVKDNIRNFGGDPDQVTLFGQSSGGESVCYHVVSPLSKGLFRRAISQSSTCNTMGVLPKPVEVAATLAEAVGCDHDQRDTGSMVSCLRQKSADELVDAYRDMMKWGTGEPGVSLRAVVDGNFLPAYPDDLYDEGQAHAVDYLLGVNDHEYGLMLPSLVDPKFGQGMTEDAFVWTLDALIGGLYPGSNTDSIVSAARQLYRDQDKPDDPMAIQRQFTHVLGDSMYVAPTVDTANRHAASGSKVYLYENHYAPAFASAFRPGWVGCDHSDDMFIVTGWPFLDVPLNGGGGLLPFSSEDRKVSGDMMAYWANFARTGNPSDGTGGPTDSPAVPEWPRYTPDNPAYMNLGLTSSADVGLHPGRVALWNDVIPKIAASSEREEL
ncbi:liver carboxylesterase-like [Branchiostoma lanceolatum]|uniref:liver carboxylesterase-like n=1 Tax=Branchiostoma lanceolatum TaxID=7740 RepID=UPI0034531550